MATTPSSLQEAYEVEVARQRRELEQIAAQQRAARDASNRVIMGNIMPPQWPWDRAAEGEPVPRIPTYQYNPRTREDQPIRIETTTARPVVGTTGQALDELLASMPARVSYATTTSAQANADSLVAAAAAGLEVVTSTPSTLLLDIDSVRDLKHFERCLPVLREVWPDLKVTVQRWDSASGNQHVRLTLTGWKLRIEERIAFELALGSDRMRGLYGLIKHRNGVCREQECSVLYRPAEKEE